MDITPVTTLEQLAGYQAVREAAFDHDYVGLPADPVEELIPWLETPEKAGERFEMVLGTVDGEPVATLRLSIPLLDNLQVLNAEVVVHPEHRRKGYGTQLTDAALARTRELGRTRVFAEVASRLDGPPVAERLLERYGFRNVLVEVRRMIDLREHPPAPRCAVPDGYRVVQWIDVAPDEFVDGLAYLMSRMSIDAPMGEMDYEQEKWDAARYREKEQAAVDRKRMRVASAVVHDSGQVAGFTDVGIGLASPEVSYQWETIVDPDHRGHGLGLVLKTWNHAYVAECGVPVRWINTWNAASNSFMIRVNEELGFVPMEEWSEYQLDL